MIIRVWLEPGQTPALRSRLLVVDSVRHAPVVYATAAGLDEVCEQVRMWLEQWTESEKGPDG